MWSESFLHRFLAICMKSESPDSGLDNFLCIQCGGWVKRFLLFQATAAAAQVNLLRQQEELERKAAELERREHELQSRGPTGH